MNTEIKIEHQVRRMERIDAELKQIINDLKKWGIHKGGRNER